MVWDVAAPLGALAAGVAFGFLAGRGDARIASQVMLAGALVRLKRVRSEIRIPAGDVTAIDFAQALQDLEDLQRLSVDRGRRS